ncbi:MAG: hypothetical protein KGH58_02460 [Candidatus Micrarchaeota archaeon]|nr:hypothetical protein [Candidatus Micrarchaeota archaeon]
MAFPRNGPKKVRGKWLAAMIAGGIAVLVIVLIVALFIIKLAWGWVVPDLFPGAVSQGLISGTIGWYTAFKLALIIAILSAILKAKH